ncbi:MAG: methionyl-tRNA formyltransferase, partial [Pseudomonadota bacterium]
AIRIEPEETTGALHDRLSALGARLIVEALDSYGELTPEPQPVEGVTYAHKIDKAEAALDWTRPAIEIDRQIRGLSPFPGAWTVHEGARLKLLASRIAKGSLPPGDVALDPLRVGCGDGAVEILALQRAGKGVQDAETFQRGTPLPAGARLGEN